MNAFKTRLAGCYKGEFLTKIREAPYFKNWTNIQFASLLCKSRQTLDRWERGVEPVSISALKQIAEVFDIPIDCLTFLATIDSESNSESDVEFWKSEFTKLHQIRKKVLKLVLAHIVELDLNREDYG